MIEQFLRLLAPHPCLGCQALGSLLCDACAGELPVLPARCYCCGHRSNAQRICQRCHTQTPLEAVYAATRYDGIATQLVHQLKFERARAAAQPIARVLVPLIKDCDGFVVTHLPTATRRVRVRGYDQSAEIARELARLLGLPYRPLLLRMGQQRQLGQSRTLRKQQMQDAFAVRNRLAVQNKHVLLVDDVLTTGSTLEAAARILGSHGATRVRAAVFTLA